MQVPFLPFIGDDSYTTEVLSCQEGQLEMDSGNQVTPQSLGVSAEAPRWGGRGVPLEIHVNTQH